MIEVKRKTTESDISVTIDVSPVKNDYRSKINTPIPFLNHMIEHIVWRSGVNITINCSLDKFELDHLVCEDVGMTLGKAVAHYVKNCSVKGYGDGIGIIDEARAVSAISFESRSLLVFDGKELLPDQTEHMLSEDLITFLDGFVQGANCTLHIDLQKGENGHHIWESIYRAVGISLGRAIEGHTGVNSTAGVAGVITYEYNEV